MAARDISHLMNKNTVREGRGRDWLIAITMKGPLAILWDKKFAEFAELEIYRTKQ